MKFKKIINFTLIGVFSLTCVACSPNIIIHPVEVVSNKNSTSQTEPTESVSAVLENSESQVAETESMDKQIDESEALPVESKSSSSSSLDEAGARALFNSNFPDVPIDVIKLEDGGEIYYMMGIYNNTKYILKVSVANGGIIVKKEIPMGR